MTTDDSDTTIDDIHRIRREIAAKFSGNLYDIAADVRTRSEKSGRKIIRRSPSSNTASHPTGGVSRSGQTDGRETA